MTNPPKRGPGRPRIHPEKLKLTISQLSAHPLVRSNLTEDQQRVLGPEYDPVEVPYAWEEPDDLDPSVAETNRANRAANARKAKARARVRKLVKRIGESLFNQGMLTNAPPEVAVPCPIPGALPPTPRPPRILTIEDHNRRVTERALAHAISDAALNNERMARVSAHASRRAARTAGRSAP